MDIFKFKAAALSGFAAAIDISGGYGVDELPPETDMKAGCG